MSDLLTPVWQKGADGRYVAVNSAFARLVGADGPSDMIGRTAFDYWPPEIAEAFTRADREAMDARQAIEREERAELNGHVRWFGTIRQPWIDADGRVVGTIGMARDVSQQRLLNAVMAARIRLSDLGRQTPLDDVLQATLAEAELLTESRVSFYHVVQPRDGVVMAAPGTPPCGYCCSEDGLLRWVSDPAALAAECVRERGVVLRNTARDAEPGLAQDDTWIPVERKLLVPVVRDNAIVAVMGLGHRSTPYSDDDVATAWQLADLAWEIVECRRQDDALRDSEQRYRELFEAESDALLLVDTGTGRVLEANTAASALYGYTHAELLALHESALVPDGAPDASGGLSEGDFGPRPVFAYHARRDGSRFPVDVTGRRFSSKGHAITIVAVRDVSERQRFEEQLAEQHRRLAEAYASLQALVVTDGLTGLLNRRAYDQRLIDERARALRSRSLSLLMIDVDRFKHYNDTYGHAAGDDVLVKVARLLLSATRGTDSVARYGGEEFVVIAPDADERGSLTLAERCRAFVAAAAWPHRGITVSVGVATWQKDAPLAELDTLPLAADKALYRAKRGGRNRVVHADGA